jgi:small subunit ribosomal protein S2
MNFRTHLLNLKLNIKKLNLNLEKNNIKLLLKKKINFTYNSKKNNEKSNIKNNKKLLSYNKKIITRKDIFSKIQEIYFFKLFNFISPVKFIKKRWSKFPILSVSKLSFTYKYFITTNSHLGYDIKRWNPEMKIYIFGARNHMHILNLIYSTLNLRRVFNIFSLLIKLRKSILFISENKEIDHVLKKIILNIGQYITCNRWIGGILSNRQVWNYGYGLLRRADPLNILDRKSKKLKLIYDGIKYLEQIPMFGIILNGVKSKWALNEFRSFNVLCAVIIDSNIGSSLNAPYLIPGNVHGFASQIFFIKLFEIAILNGELKEKQFFLNRFLNLQYSYFNNRKNLLTLFKRKSFFLNLKIIK